MDAVKEHMKQLLTAYTTQLCKEYLQSYNTQGFRGVLEFNSLNVDKFCIYFDETVQIQSEMHKELDIPLPNLKLTLLGCEGLQPNISFDNKSLNTKPHDNAPDLLLNEIKKEQSSVPVTKKEQSSVPVTGLNENTSIQENGKYCIEERQIIPKTVISSKTLQCSVHTGKNVKMSKHTGQTPYQCKLCATLFRHSTSLTVHVMQHHTGERKHACELCGKTFVLKTLLKMHSRTHTSEYI